jgi:hypothetical protein
MGTCNLYFFEKQLRALNADRQHERFISLVLSNVFKKFTSEVAICTGTSDVNIPHTASRDVTLLIVLCQLSAGAN